MHANTSVKGALSQPATQLASQPTNLPINAVSLDVFITFLKEKKNNATDM